MNRRIKEIATHSNNKQQRIGIIFIGLNSHEMNNIPIEVIGTDIVYRLVESKMWMNFIKLTDKCNPISRHYMFKVHGMHNAQWLQVPTSSRSVENRLRCTICGVQYVYFRFQPIKEPHAMRLVVYDCMTTHKIHLFTTFCNVNYGSIGSVWYHIV